MTIGKDSIERCVRRQVHVQETLNNQNTGAAAQEAIAYYVHGVTPPSLKSKGGKTWKYVEAAYKRCIENP